MANRRKNRKRRPKTGPPWWPCEKTGKQGFASKLDALTVLANASRTRATQRTYKCGHCGRWHLTSKPKVGLS